MSEPTYARVATTWTAGKHRPLPARSFRDKIRRALGRPYYTKPGVRNAAPVSIEVPDSTYLTLHADKGPQ